MLLLVIAGLEQTGTDRILPYPAGAGFTILTESS